MRWCTKRITTPKLLMRLGDGKHRFFLESVCGQACEDTEEWCETCRALPVQMVNQDVCTYPHGNVDGPYTGNSKIFGSPYYLKNVKIYGEPEPEHLALAMEAQKRARAGRKTKQLSDLREEPKGDPPAAQNPLPKQVPDGAKQKPKHDGTRKIKLPKPTTLPPSQNILAVLGAHTEQVITQVPAQAGLQVETTDTPMEVSEVIEVILKPFTHNNVKYWRDGAREKLYRRTADGKRGEYVGRWDADAEEIVRDAPDSDAVGED
jgi:hypothetical protein